ncbi:hypothetical protein WJ542_17165, partial [Paraburkholderia sp. B3]|uniref:hypothetical protein n=1 Tax=Paraburkholderia sp. B3 TaxID=3134791 RepID=UPI003982CA23
MAAITIIFQLKQRFIENNRNFEHLDDESFTLSPDAKPAQRIATPGTQGNPRSLGKYLADRQARSAAPFPASCSH